MFFCPYNLSQWGPKQHWAPLTFIVWTKKKKKQNKPHRHFQNIFVSVSQKKESHKGLERHEDE